MNGTDPIQQQETFDEASLLGAFLLDGKGGGHSLRWKEIISWKPDQGPLWIHLDLTVADTRKWLRKRSGLDPVVCDALLAEETRPRAQTMRGGVLVILRGVNMNPGETPDDMIAVRIWVDQDRIITLRAPRLLAVGDVRDLLNEGKGPVNPAGMLVAIAEKMTARMAPVLSNIDDLVDGIEEQVLEGQQGAHRRNLSEIRRQAISLRRYIAPQREAIVTLQNSQLPWLSQLDMAHLRECSDRTTRYVEDLDALRERATLVHEELAAKTSEQMNRTMYSLSVVAGIFLPLSFITGLLGINVGGIPGMDNPHAFAMVCAILVCLAVLALLVFRRLKFF